MAIGYPEEFGHIYDDLDLTNSISSTDIKDSQIKSQDIAAGTVKASNMDVDETGAVRLTEGNSKKLNQQTTDQLFVWKSRQIDCQFHIIQCGAINTGCPATHSVKIDGSFVVSQVVDPDGTTCTTGSPLVALCCKP